MYLLSPFPESQSCSSLPAVRPSLLQCLFQLLQSFFRRSHRDTIPEQTNAAVRNSAPPPCTGDRKHGHVKQLFVAQTQIQSLSRMARCACMTLRNNQPCTSASQDGNYQTLQECPSNRHHTLHLSQKHQVRMEITTVTDLYFSFLTSLSCLSFFTSSLFLFSLTSHLSFFSQLSRLSLLGSLVSLSHVSPSRFRSRSFFLSPLSPLSVRV